MNIFPIFHCIIKHLHELKDMFLIAKMSQKTSLYSSIFYQDAWVLKKPLQIKLILKFKFLGVVLILRHSVFLFSEN